MFFFLQKLGLRRCGIARTRANERASDNREGEVDGLGHAEVAGKQCVEVPEDERVDDDVDAQHDVDVGHREPVVLVYRMPQVVPLYPSTCTHARLQQLVSSRGLQCAPPSALPVLAELRSCWPATADMTSGPQLRIYCPLLRNYERHHV